MKNTIKNYFVAAFALSTITSCSNESTEAVTNPESELAISEPVNEAQKACSYVDANWSSTAQLSTYLGIPEDNAFMNNQLTKMVNLFGGKRPILRHVYDSANPSSTFNAFSYPTGKIYYGNAMFYYAKGKSADNIVNAMVLAHEYGHQLQFNNNIPSIKESTQRSSELQADAFAGYYLKKPAGFNKTDFSQIAAAYEFAEAIGDYNYSSFNHHGTPPQRRSAVRLGFLLGDYQLSIKQFDNIFSNFYQNVLQGNFKMNGGYKISEIPEVDAMLKAHLEELQKIYTGEISAEEFKDLK